MKILCNSWALFAVMLSVGVLPAPFDEIVEITNGFGVKKVYAAEGETIPKYLRSGFTYSPGETGLVRNANGQILGKFEVQVPPIEETTDMVPISVTIGKPVKKDGKWYMGKFKPIETVFPWNQLSLLKSSDTPLEEVITAVVFNSDGDIKPALVKHLLSLIEWASLNNAIRRAEIRKQGDEAYRQAEELRRQGDEAYRRGDEAYEEGLKDLAEKLGVDIIN
jgi:hypothetical protein